jgi:hypothetical protein
VAEARSGVARLAISFAATASLAVAVVVVSESWFWARLRPGDSVLGFVGTIVAYGLAVQVVRFVAHRWRVSAEGPGAWRRILLLGALYGWLVEGVIVTTVIDDLPFTLSWTGLAWHALFTVLVGWWWIPRTLDRPARGSVWRLGAVGASVGVWAAFWRFEDGAAISIGEYAAYVGVTTLAYAAGLAGWWALRGRAAPRLPGSLTAMVLLAALAVLNAIENPLTLVGPALVALALVALITTAPRVESAPTDAAPEPLAGPTPWRALGRLAVIPVAATLVFALLTSAPDAIPTGWLLVGITAPFGALLFVVAWVAALRRRPQKARE